MNREVGPLQLVGTDGGLMRFGPDKPLRLDSRAELRGLEIAYRTYGTLNADRSNAVPAHPRPDRETSTRPANIR